MNILRIFKTKKADIRRIAQLAFPAVLQEALTTLATYVDVLMVGALGPRAVAAVGLTTTTGWLLTSVPTAIGAGVLVACAQAAGAQDDALLRKTGQQSLFLTLAVGAVLTLIALGIAPSLAGWLGAAEEIRAAATTYFIITFAPALFRTAHIVFSNALRGVSDMRTPMIITTLMNVLNVILNFFFIYPTRSVAGITVFGLGLGVTGAAIATAAAYVFGGVFMFLAYLKNKRFLALKTGFHFHWPSFRRCVSIALPLAVDRGTVSLGHVVFTGLVTKLGVAALAAHTVAIQVEELFYIPSFGFQSATATLIGNAMGERNEKKLRETTTLICAVITLMMLVAGVLLFFIAPWMVRMFTPDAEVVRLGTLALRVIAVTEPVYGLLIIFEGVFNGMGDVRMPVVISIFTTWCIRVLGAVIVVNVLGLGLGAAWLMMGLDNIIRCALLITRYKRGGWRRRLQEAEAYFKSAV